MTDEVFRLKINFYRVISHRFHLSYVAFTEFVVSSLRIVHASKTAYILVLQDFKTL